MTEDRDSNVGREGQLLTGGEWYETGEWLDVSSPYTETLVGRVPWATVEQVDEAISSAAGAMHDAPLEASARADILLQAADLIAERAGMLAETIVAEAGKPITLARLEVERAEITMRESARVAETLRGEVVPLDGTKSGAGHSAETVRVPVGVVAAITPFNFPLNLSIHKVAPAIAAGCAVVHKPADKTPLSGVELARILQDAGLPPGYLNLVVADPAEACARFLAAPEVGLITFTGSAAIGWGIAKAAERTKVALELGNSTPVVVSRSANIDRAAQITAHSAFMFAGQACVSAQRAIVETEVLEEFTARIVELAEEAAAGNPEEAATLVGPVITPEAHDRVLGAIEAAVEQGASLLTGGKSLGQNVVAPTVLGNVSPEAPISCQEVFGPVLGIIASESFDESLRVANGTDYGLQAAVFTDSLTEATKAASVLDFGSVIINDAPSFRADPMPYGGVKASGNTKEGPAYAIREMTEERLIVRAD